MKINKNYGTDNKLKTLQLLTDNYGYWSKEVMDYNSELDYTEMTELNNKLKR